MPVGNVPSPSSEVLAQRCARALVVGPAFRIGARQVHDHAAPAVDAGRTGPWVGRAERGAVGEVDDEVVVHAVQIAVERGGPCAIVLQLHGNGLDEPVAGLLLRTACEQPQRHSLRRRCPESELGAGFSDLGTQLAFQTQRERFCDTRLQSFGQRLECLDHD